MRPLLLLPALLLAAAGCSDPLEVPEGAAAGWNVLVITLDTTRPDYLGAYGAANAGTATIDAIAREGVRFDRAFASVPLTLPSHCTLFTGRYPPGHGVRNNGTYALPGAAITLAEIVREQGWDTAAFVSCFVLDERFGLAQGFDDYEFAATSAGHLGPQTLEHERDASHVTKSAMRWLDGRGRSDRPFLLWVHYFDPHAPYRPPATRARPNVLADPKKAYAAEIAYTDLWVGELVRAVGKHADLDRTLIVLASDHGEGLGDHDEDEHGIFIYDSTMRVALVFRAPGLLPAGMAVDDRVAGSVDVTPTVLHLLGLRAPDGLDGRALFAGDGPDPERAIYLESVFAAENMASAPLFGFRRLHDKAIQAPRPEYYDLRADPGERDESWDVIPEDARELLGRQVALAAGAQPGDARELSPGDRESLESLGYVQAGGGSADPTRDPKDQMPLLRALREALALQRDGRLEEALAVAERVTREVGPVDVAVMLVAELQTRTGSPEEGIRTLETFVADHANPDVMTALAHLHFEAGDYGRMEELLAEIERIDPWRGSVPLLRGDRFRAERDLDAAAREYERAIEIDGVRAGEIAGAKLEAVRRETGG